MRRVLVSVTFTAFLFGICHSGAPLAAGADADVFAEPRATLHAAHDLLFAKLDAAKFNSDDAYDIVTRLADATAALDSQPANDPQRVADERIHANLDLAWIAGVTSGSCPRPAALGASETCFRSSVDNTLQPLAVYVPATVAAGSSAPLVVALRGRGETESELISLSDLRALADESHAILVAPYARGRATYDRAATQDVLDALADAEQFANVDVKRTYLAGFSMGGIAAFHVATVAPTRFVAMLSIVGALNPIDRDGIRAFERPIYVVNAEHDTLISPEHGRESVAYLKAIGHAARYYEQKNGVHSLHSVLPAVRDAWHDMFAGVTRPSGDAPFTVPSGTATLIPAQGRPT